MSQNLLFVDDDSGDVQLTLLGFRLQKFEPQVVVAKDGKEALDILISDCEASRPLPLAILTDIKMPRMDGLELLRRVKGEPRLRAIPIAILTSSDHEADRKEALGLGANCYFMKPSDLDAYAEIVSRIRAMMETGSEREAVKDSSHPSR
ncbi:MAG: response regulator [Elusimicrobia bacterium]|nr:response regulator [Elusimicrobiota bacterium]